MININRHNYEEFFLLYTDRELNASGRMAVEQFVQENPDLAAELEALQQTTLLAEDTIPIPAKDSLFRTIDTDIHAGNHTEQFLLYVDRELTPEAAVTVETFVLQHPGLQEPFIQLKQTRLPEEHIPFPDKSLLYRSATTNREPVVYMRWWRIAAAAVIGFAFMVWMITADDVPVINHTQPLSANNSSTGNVNHDSNIITSGNSAGQNTQASVTNKTTEPITTVATKQPVMQQAEALKQVVAMHQPNTQAIHEMNEKNDLVMERQDIISSIENSKQGFATPKLVDAKNNGAISENDLVKTLVAIEPDTDKNPVFQQVVYKELDTESDSENKSLLIGSVEINKDKLRGFFRKAGSLFRSKRTEEEKSKTTTGTTRSLK